MLGRSRFSTDPRPAPIVAHMVGLTTIATSKEHYDLLWFTRQAIGTTMDAFSASLLERGLKTLKLRADKTAENALAMAQFLAGHPKVSSVIYPGLEGDSGHEAALKQMHGGFGGVLAFDVGSSQDDAKQFINALEVIVHAVSLGAPESSGDSSSSAEAFETVEPVGKRVLIRKDEDKKETKGGIRLPDNIEIPTLTGRIVAVSTEVDSDPLVPLKRYDKVLFNPKGAIPVDFEGDNRLFVVEVENVVAVFRKS